MVKVLNFKTIIEQDEDGYFVASIPSVPGCYSQGITYEEATKNVKEALELCLETAEGLPSYKSRIVYPEDNQHEQFIGITTIPISFTLS